MLINVSCVYLWKCKKNKYLLFLILHFKCFHQNIRGNHFENRWESIASTNTIQKRKCEANLTSRGFNFSHSLNEEFVKSIFYLFLFCSFEFYSILFVLFWLRLVRENTSAVFLKVYKFCVNLTNFTLKAQNQMGSSCCICSTALSLMNSALQKCEFRVFRLNRPENVKRVCENN